MALFLLRGRRHIVEQMEKNQEERSLLAEQQEQEKEQMLEYMEKLQEEDLRVTGLHRSCQVLPATTKATLWVKAQHEGALPPPCIVRKDPRVPHTARRGA